MFVGLTKKAAATAQRASTYVAVLALMYLAVIVAANIAARAIFDLTEGGYNFIIAGAIEQTGLALVVLVFAALGASLNNAMIGVDIFTSRMPAGLQSLLSRIWMLLTACVFALLIWLFVHEATTMLKRGDTTQDLNLPLHLFYWIASAQCFAISLIALNLAVDVSATNTSREVS